MAKAVVVYPIMATAFVALLLFSPSEKSLEPAVHNARLNRRLAGARAFAMDMMHNAELKRGSEKEEEQVPDMNGEDEKMELLSRLRVSYPFIDGHIQDGYVESKVLENWNIMQAYKRMQSRTKKQMDQNDKNENGLISFSEYLPYFSDQDIRENDKKHGEAGWWMDQFKNCDIDGDWQLNFEEFQDFLHPEDSKNTKVQEWLLHDKIRKMDKDNDGMLNLEEFTDHAYDNFKTYYLFSTGEVSVSSPQEQFSKLDLNRDGLLTTEELKPIQELLFPGELNYASYITNYVIKEVDDDKDGRLSLNEILKHEDKFFHGIYSADDEDEDEDEDEDYIYEHDEF